MGMLSDFFIADEDAATNYDGGEAIPDSDKCQFKWISPLQAAQFLSVIRDQPYSVEMIGEFELITPQEAEDWTMRVPSDMVHALSELPPEEVPPLASKFATITSEELGWPPEDFVSVIQELSVLAKRAVESGNSMFLWNCI